VGRKIYIILLQFETNSGTTVNCNIRSRAVAAFSAIAKALACRMRPVGRMLCRPATDY